MGEAPDPRAEIDPKERARALLDRWQRTGDVDALGQLLRWEVDILARRLRARAGGAVSASYSASDIAQEAVLGRLRLDEAAQFDDPRAMAAYLRTLPTGSNLVPDPLRPSKFAEAPRADESGHSTRLE